MHVSSITKNLRDSGHVLMETAGGSTVRPWLRLYADVEKDARPVFTSNLFYE